MSTVIINPFMFSAPPVVSHRYWGIDITAYNNVGGNGGFGELEFYDASGALLSFGHTAYMTAGHTVGAGEDLSRVFDGRVGVTAGNFHVTDTNPITVWVDFGAPVAVSRMRVIAFEEGFNSGMPKDYALVYSDDAVTFTPAVSTTNQTGWGYFEGRVLDNPSVLPAYNGAPGRSSTQWRILCSTYYAPLFEAGLSELEMYATIGGARQVPSSATATTSDAGGSPAYLYDNSDGTFWCSDQAANPPIRTQYVTYTFASPVQVAQLGMRARNDGSPPASDIGKQMPREVFLQFYDATAGYWRFADRLYDPSASYAAPGELRKFASDVALV